MNKIQENNSCGRAEQLLGYLYGESNDGARASFEGHLSQCASCRDEIQAFGQVREAVGAWRAELMEGAPKVAVADVLSAEAPSRTVRVDATPRRSAMVALREFFALSPGWLRFGGVAAALAICALAALAIVNAEVRWEKGNFAFHTGVRAESAGRPAAPQTLPPGAGDAEQAQLDQLIAERDRARRELEEARAQLDDSRVANIEAVYREIGPQPESAAPPAPGGANRPRRAGGGSISRRTRTRREFQDEENLPRLLDLLSSGN